MHHFDNFPPVPLTLEGSSLLHQIMRIRWREWRALSASRRDEIVKGASAAFALMEKDGSGTFSMFGHKGDLLLIHFRKNFDELADVERDLTRLALWDYLEPSTSYLSVVELGLYESTMKVYSTLAEKSVAPHTPEWDAAIQETLERQKTAMQPRLYPEVPPHKFVCFYPMDRLRGELKNWYQLPIAERQRQMAEHGEVGRRYAGRVKQIISGSIGLDDWEWGVDLFADDPIVFKHLIYEMRFDEVSAVYAKFGQFFVGIRVPAEELSKVFSL
jgi:hydrogen peroxide-dependent heme synthase